MKTRGMLAAGAALLALMAGCSSSRFGDSSVLGQIKSSTDCSYLQSVNDKALHDFDGGDPDVNWTPDQATGYYNATSDRMKQLAC